MESLNLNALAGSLPTSNLASAEKELLNNFRAAALSITNLYRSSRSTSKRAYNSGYAAACADLLQMIQQSVSDSDPETPPSIGRVMDWVEARLEAIRAREEEEEEEDEESAASRKEKEGGTGRLKASSSLPRANSAPAVPQQPPREQVPIAPSKLSQAITITTGPTLPSPSTPPSPPATTTVRPLSTPTPPPTTTTTTTITVPTSRTLKPRAFATALQAKENPHLVATTPNTTNMILHHHHHPPFPTSPGSPSPFTFTAFPPLPTSAAPTDALAIPLPLPLTVSAGAKRRHAAMMVLAEDNAHAPAAVGAGTTMATSGPAGSSRRRTRSTRGAHQHQNQHAQDAMDIEEEGRERKRVARR